MSDREASVSWELALARSADLADALSVSSEVSEVRRIGAGAALLELRSKVRDRQGHTLCEATFEVLCEHLGSSAAHDLAQPGDPGPRQAAASAGALYWSAALPPQEPAAFTPLPM